MDDQNIKQINGLSYEEELDVLEAVYKIGKEKGIELLRPDQMKKLVDGGRMNGAEDVKLSQIKGKKGQKVDDVRNIHANVREVVTQIVSTIEQHFPEADTTQMDESQLRQLRQDLFYLSFGKTPQDYAFDLFTSLTSETK